MKDYDAESLRLMFPNLGLELESLEVISELRDHLGLQAAMEVVGGSAVVTVTLNDGYILSIRPANPGFNGVTNWFEWRSFTHPRTGDAVTLPKVRCTVELGAFESGADNAMAIFSFGADGTNMQQVISKALENIHKYCALRLVALPQVNANNQFN
jgi:hypothetical protein